MAEYELAGALGTDFYEVFAEVPEQDRAVWERARAFVAITLPEVNEAWERAEYPAHWIPRLGEHGLLNDGVEGPGLHTVSPLAAGLVNMELARADGSLSTIVAVQAGLTLRSIAMFGSAEQKERWLGPLERGEIFGAFALTEPDHGSDAVALSTRAVREGSDWVLSGEKKWIGNGAAGLSGIPAVSVVWARDEEGAVRGFLVEQDRPGYLAETITGKVSLRAIHQARIRLDAVRVPADAVLPEARSFKDTSRVLAATRLGVAWSALGHATAAFEAALTYAKQRIQFGRPLAATQLVQERLTRMLSELTSVQLHCVRLAALDTAGTLQPLQASLAKFTATRIARGIAATARDMLGGNGILLENHVMRHLADIEAIHTYEGTESVQALLVGRALTGHSAFA